MEPLKQVLTPYAGIDAAVFVAQLREPNKTHDIIYKICSYLSYRDLVSLELVSKAWQKVATCGEFWQAHYQGRFGLPFGSPDGMTDPPWKTWFKHLHLLVRESKIGDIHDKNMPEQARELLGSDTGEIERRLAEHKATGAFYVLAALQGVREARKMLDPLHSFRGCVKSTSCEESLNFSLVERICFLKIMAITKSVLRAKDASSQQGLLGLHPNVLVKRLRYIGKGLIQSNASTVIDAMQNLTIASRDDSAEKIWTHVRSRVLPKEQPENELHYVVGSLKTRLPGNGRDPVRIYARVLVNKLENVKFAIPEPEFHFYRKGVERIATLRLEYDETRDPKVMRCVCLWRLSLPVMTFHLEQLAFELALCEDVPCLEIQMGRETCLYDQAVDSDGTIRYVAKENVKPELTKARFNHPLIDIQGRFFPTPTKLFLEDTSIPPTE